MSSRHLKFVFTKMNNCWVLVFRVFHITIAIFVMRVLVLLNHVIFQNCSQEIIKILLFSLCCCLREEGNDVKLVILLQNSFQLAVIVTIIFVMMSPNDHCEFGDILTYPFILAIYRDGTKRFKFRREAGNSTRQSITGSANPGWAQGTRIFFQIRSSGLSKNTLKIVLSTKRSL